MTVPYHTGPEVEPARLVPPGARTLGDLVRAFEGRTVCLALSRDPNAKLTVLFFEAGESHPARAAKVPTTAGAAGAVLREAATLRSLHTMSLGAIGSTVPTVVDVVDHDGLPAMVTRGVPGMSMLARYHSWRHTARPRAVAEDFAAAAGWLGLLQQRTAAGTTDLAEMLRGVPERLGRRFDGSPELPAALATVADLRRRLGGWRVPCTAVHGDFWLGNVLVTDGRVTGVVDWESGRLRGLPVHDLARFALAYSLYLDRHAGRRRRVAGHRQLRAGRWGAGIDYAVDGTGWYPGAVRCFLADGLRRLGLPAALGRDVVLAELAVVAAEADHAAFARQHLRVLRRLSSEAAGPQGAGR